MELYRNAEKRLLAFSYTASQKIKGSEMIAFCDGLIIPEGNYASVVFE